MTFYNTNFCLFLLLTIFLTIIHGKDYNLHSCNGEIKQDSASSNARLGDSSWIQDSYCIEPHPGDHKWIKLRIHYLQLPMSDDCIDEKLVIFSNRVIQRPSSVSYCGNMTNVELILPSSRAVVRFEARINEGGYHLPKEKREFHLSYHCFTEAEKQSSKPPAPLHCCRPNEYACNPRFYVTLQETTCLPKNKVCDGISQCPYGDDEWHRNCLKPTSSIPPTTIESDGNSMPFEFITSTISSNKFFYTCAYQTNSTIPIKRIKLAQLCDGKVDCPMADDELCFRGCKPDQFKCVGSSRMCLSKKYLCDNQLDCADGLDESCDYRGRGDLQFSTSTETISSTEPTTIVTTTAGVLRTTPIETTESITNTKLTSSIPLFHLTTPIQLVCNKNYFLCKEARRCIPNLWVCDNYPDCSSAEDEDPTLCAARRLSSSTISPTIPSSITTTPNNARREVTVAHSCSENEFVCPRTGTCLAMERVCDGIVDCSHHEDENVMLCSRGQHKVTLAKQQQQAGFAQTTQAFSSLTTNSPVNTSPTSLIGISTQTIPMNETTSENPFKRAEMTASQTTLKSTPTALLQTVTTSSENTTHSFSSSTTNSPVDTSVTTSTQTPLNETSTENRIKRSDITIEMTTTNTHHHSPTTLVNSNVPTTTQQNFLTTKTKKVIP